MIHKVITRVPPESKQLIDILEVIDSHRKSCEKIMTSSTNDFQPVQSYIVDKNGKPGKEFLVTFIDEEICKTKTTN